VAITSNFVGAALNAGVQRNASWALLVVVLALCAFIYPQVHHGYSAVLPVFEAPGPIFSGIIVAFWAYAGFENLTFIAGEFRNPRRDFPLAMLIAFLAYGTLTIILTLLIAALIPRNQVSSLSGLFQLAARITPTWLATGIIVIFALMIMQLNTASWLWGMSRLIYASAREGRLPHWFAQLNKRDLPARAIFFLGILFVLITAITSLWPDLLVNMLSIASSSFLFIYLLCLISYLRLTHSMVRRLIYGIFLLFLLVILGSVGFKILYPTVIFLLALFASMRRGLRQVSPETTKEGESSMEEGMKG
jgi:amino acid efflux transporter